MKTERRQIEGRTKGRLALALAMSAPLAVFATLLILFGLVALASSGRLLPELQDTVPRLLLIAFAVGWPATLILGLPSHIWLYRRRARKLANYIMAGLGGGVICTALIAVFFVQRMPTELAELTTAGMLLLLVCAASVGAYIIFWMIRRPDRDTVSDAALTQMFS